MPYFDGRIGMLATEEGPRVMCGMGTGEEAARVPLRAGVGHGGGDLKLLGISSGSGARPTLEVWLAEGLRPPAETTPDGPLWISMERLLRLVSSGDLRHPRTLAALNVVPIKKLVS